VSLGAGGAGPVPDVPEEVRGPWDPRVRVFRAGAEVDAFCVVGDRAVAVVDTMSSPQLAEGMLAALGDDLTGRALVVVNTHQHHDHTWGNCAVPAPVIAHPAGPAIALGAAAARFLEERRAAEARFARVRIVPPTVTVPDGAEVHLGGLTLVLVHAPGHTPDHLAVWIPELRLLLPGDAAEHPFPYAEAPAGPADLAVTLRRLAALDPETVLPCHGGTHDPGLLARNLAYLDRVIATGGGPGAEAAFPSADALAMSGTDAGRVPAFYADFHRQNLLNAAIAPAPSGRSERPSAEVAVDPQAGDGL
jgi:glyoxylase-like metal-dependent hydrolase (beta-lactamase superfamily II)